MTLKSMLEEQSDGQTQIIAEKKSQSKSNFKKIVKGQVRKAGKKRRVATEPELWKNLDAIAVGAFDFWQAFFGLLMGPNNDNPLNATAIANFRKIIRSVSWVESKHGTAGSAGNFPSRDPMQCGNPLDAWWKVLIGGSPKTERFVGGPNVKNYWAEELPA